MNATVDCRRRQLPQRVSFSLSIYGRMAGISAANTDYCSSHRMAANYLKGNLSFSLRSELASYDNRDWHFSPTFSAKPSITLVTRRPRLPIVDELSNKAIAV